MPSTTWKKLRFLLLPVLALVLASAPSESTAETINFVPPGINVVDGDLLFIGSTVSVIASAYETTFFDPHDVYFGDSMQVTVSNQGLGVNGRGSDPSDQLDGVAINEYLVLKFSKIVNLVSFTLRNIDLNGTDGVSVYLGNGMLPAYTQTGLTSNPTTIGFATPLVGDRFVFTVAGGNSGFDFGLKSDFSLSAVNVNVAQTQAVPTPAAALGGGALLAVLAGYRRLRRGRVSDTIE